MDPKVTSNLIPKRRTFTLNFIQQIQKDSGCFHLIIECIWNFCLISSPPLHQRLSILINYLTSPREYPLINFCSVSAHRQQQRIEPTQVSFFLPAGRDAQSAAVLRTSHSSGAESESWFSVRHQVLLTTLGLIPQNKIHASPAVDIHKKFTTKNMNVFMTWSVLSVVTVC